MLKALQQKIAEMTELVSAPHDGELTGSEKVGCLQAAHQLEQIAYALKIRLAREADADGVPAASGGRTLSSWLRSTLLLDPTPAKELATAAHELRRQPSVEEALQSGAIDSRQATVIVAAVTDIPDTLDDGQPTDPQIIDEARATMLDMASRLPAYQLRRVGERILDHVAPGAADQATEESMLKREKRAHKRRHFTLSLPEDGLVRLSGALTVEDAAVVQAAILPLCMPSQGDDQLARQRRADALVQVCRLALSSGELPGQGGEPPQVVVTIPFDPIRRELGRGTFDNGEQISAASARRLACDARILPVLLGSEGQVLDVGRARRLASGPLRRALVVRDRGCAFPDCDRPPRWTDAHHIIAWDHGGGTDLDNLVLLCRRHHRLVHDPLSGWKVRMGPERIPDFYAPIWENPEQTPMRNQVIRPSAGLT